MPPVAVVGMRDDLTLTGGAMEFETSEREELTDEQKEAILEAYRDSLSDEGEDALAALEELRAARGFDA